MKRILKSAFITCSVVFAMTALTSCGGEEDTLDTVEPTTADKTAKLPSADGNAVVKNINAPAGSTVKFNVEFEKADKKMYRLYVSQNVYGTDDGTVAYDVNANSVKVDTKRDGSIDLGSDDKEGFKKTLNLPAPTAENGVVEYRIWATSGSALSAAKGDFRDTEVNNAYGKKGQYIIVKITAGKGVSATGIKEFSATILAAPLDDGTSKTFMSVYNGKTYPVNEAGSAALWDFGYFYGTNEKASLRSLKLFPPSAVNVPSVSGIAEADLNSFFIKKGSSLDFATVTLAQLGSIATPSSTKAIELVAGNVCEFQDAYGTKGLIKVTSVTGTNGTNGKITFDVKVQDASVKP